MKGVIVKKYIKGVEESRSLIANDAPEPKPDFTKDEVLIEVKCIGLNFFDILQMQGRYQTQPPMPFIAGTEFAGIVIKSGPSCPMKPGTRVCGAQQGAFGERVAVDYKSLIVLPDNIPYDEGSGIFIQYLLVFKSQNSIDHSSPTSYASLVTRADVQAGEWVLVHAAAGGVGLAACQIAHAKVIGVSSKDKHDILKKYGNVDHALDYEDEKWPQKAKQLANNGKGVNVVLDPIGALVKSLKSVAWNARLVVIGFAAGEIEKVPANLLLLKQASVMGLFWGAHRINDPAMMPRVYDALMKLFAEGKIKVAVYDKKYQGFEALPEALVDMWNRKTWGKAVVRLESDSSKL